MAIYDLTKKTKASTGQRVIPLGPVDNTMRVIKLEKRLNDQEQKLDNNDQGKVEQEKQLELPNFKYPAL